MDERIMEMFILFGRFYYKWKENEGFSLKLPTLIFVSFLNFEDMDEREKEGSQKMVLNLI